MSTKIKCKECGDEAISNGHRHNFVSCSCGKSFVDGGDASSRYGGLCLVYDEINNKWIDPFENNN